MIDSNILVYTVDVAESDKQLQAIQVLRALRMSGRGVLCAQVLGEFLNASTRRLAIPLVISEAEERAFEFSLTMPVFETSSEAILDGARGVRVHQLSVWDAVIWATTKRNGVPYLLSEDMGHGQLFEGVRILNPLRGDFDMSLLA
jgi:predicted nucleic acid-binding protein